MFLSPKNIDLLQIIDLTAFVLRTFVLCGIITQASLTNCSSMKPFFITLAAAFGNFLQISDLHNLPCMPVSHISYGTALVDV